MTCWNSSEISSLWASNLAATWQFLGWFSRFFFPSFSFLLPVWRKQITRLWPPLRKTAAFAEVLDVWSKAPDLLRRPNWKSHENVLDSVLLSHPTLSRFSWPWWHLSPKKSTAVSSFVPVHRQMSIIMSGWKLLQHLSHWSVSPYWRSENTIMVDHGWSMFIWISSEYYFVLDFRDRTILPLSSTPSLSRGTSREPNPRVRPSKRWFSWALNICPRFSWLITPRTVSDIRSFFRKLWSSVGLRSPTGKIYHLPVFWRSNSPGLKLKSCFECLKPQTCFQNIGKTFEFFDIFDLWRSEFCRSFKTVRSTRSRTPDRCFASAPTRPPGCRSRWCPTAVKRPSAEV